MTDKRPIYTTAQALGNYLFRTYDENEDEYIKNGSELGDRYTELDILKAYAKVYLSDASGFGIYPDQFKHINSITTIADLLVYFENCLEDPFRRVQIPVICQKIDILSNTNTDFTVENALEFLEPSPTLYSAWLVPGTLPPTSEDDVTHGYLSATFDVKEYINKYYSNDAAPIISVLKFNRDTPPAFAQGIVNWTASTNTTLALDLVVDGSFVGRAMLNTYRSWEIESVFEISLTKTTDTSGTLTSTFDISNYISTYNSDQENAPEITIYGLDSTITTHVDWDNTEPDVLTFTIDAGSLVLIKSNDVWNTWSIQ